MLCCALHDLHGQNGSVAPDTAASAALLIYIVTAGRLLHTACLLVSKEKAAGQLQAAVDQHQPVPQRCQSL